MRIVIKIGTSTLTYNNGCVNIRRIESLCRAISDMKNSGCEVILVSSGAIGMGVGKLNLKERPSDSAGKQAAAAVGQCELMYVYDKLFSEHHHTVAQLLLTAFQPAFRPLCHKGIRDFCRVAARVVVGPEFNVSGFDEFT